MQDDSTIFELEAMYSGNLYFLCTAFKESVNITGAKGWYLTMSPQGQLSGNGGKNELSQWMMLTEQPPQANGIIGADGTTTAPTSAQTQNSTGATGVLSTEQNPILNAPGGAAVVAHGSSKSGIGAFDAGSDGTFPGVAAGRDVLMKYFLTTGGVKFLQQPEYAAAYELYRRNGLLSKILHRFSSMQEMHY